MKPALVVVDLLRDTFDRHAESFIVKSAKTFLPRLNDLIDAFHQRAFPVIFACDSFLPDDFIFQGGMEPHSLRGTPGESIIIELHRNAEDHILRKRRFSAFFKTDLDQTLRTLGIDVVLVTGIAASICVLTTALDAISHDFSAIIVDDCCAAHRLEHHKAIVDVYRHTPLYPLLQVMKSDQCFELLA
ncbi:MAG: isochorismatase family cysteine hydrolase [Syntrophobacteraceae bacterium]|jgi:nicotinamidase-related amidase